MTAATARAEWNRAGPVKAVQAQLEIIVIVCEMELLGCVYDDDGQFHTCRCDAECGNGKREFLEACDDGNTVNRDGCSSSCMQVEPKYICSLGNATTPDSCYGKR